MEDALHEIGAIVLAGSSGGLLFRADKVRDVLLSLLAMDRREMAAQLLRETAEDMSGPIFASKWLLSKAEELERPLNHTIVSCKRQEEEERP